MSGTLLVCDWIPHLTIKTKEIVLESIYLRYFLILFPKHCQWRVLTSPGFQVRPKGWRAKEDNVKDKVFYLWQDKWEGKVKDNELSSYENWGKCDTINGLSQMHSCSLGRVTPGSCRASLGGFSFDTERKMSSEQVLNVWKCSIYLLFCSGYLLLLFTSGIISLSEFQTYYQKKLIFRSPTKIHKLFCMKWHLINLL